MITAGPIPNLIEGWAKAPFAGERVHHWHLAPNCSGTLPFLMTYESACGQTQPINAERAPMLRGGDYPRCKACQATLGSGTVDPRPGHYYVSALRYDGKKSILLRGPFATHQEALDMVDAVRAACIEHTRDAVWWAFGTGRQDPDSEPMRCALGPDLQPIPFDSPAND